MKPAGRHREPQTIGEQLRAAFRWHARTSATERPPRPERPAIKVFPALPVTEGKPDDA